MIKQFFVNLLKKHLWKLPDNMLNRALAHAITNRKFSDLFSTPQISGRKNIWSRILNEIGADQKILFLEFGVWKGESFRYFCQELTNDKSRLIGFDTFEGLPEDWGHRPVGTYSANGEIPDINDPRVEFKVGLFQQTLPYLQADFEDYDAVLVHMDADLYSSTLFVLSELWKMFPEIYVLFDEFIGDEARALYNFSQGFPSTIEFIAHDGVPPKRIACKISDMSGRLFQCKLSMT